MIRATVRSAVQAGGINIVVAKSDDGQLHLLNEFTCPLLEPGCKIDIDPGQRKVILVEAAKY